MNKLIIANWKNNPASVAEAVKLAEETDHENLVICPPMPFLKSVASVIKKSLLGAQDLPESSVVEFKNLGVKYVILGHSDRRKLGETNEMISKKMSVAIKEGFIPILCVGENWEEKQRGDKERVITNQIQSVFPSFIIPNSLFKIYIAYEPVWAISTSETGRGPDSPEEALETIKSLKKIVNAHFIYGGSVNSKNIGSFLKYDEIEGALVGGASLDPEEVRKMLCYN